MPRSGIMQRAALLAPKAHRAKRGRPQGPCAEGARAKRAPFGTCSKNEELAINEDLNIDELAIYGGTISS